MEKRRIAFDLHGVLRPYDSQLTPMESLFTRGIAGTRVLFVELMQDQLKTLREKGFEIWIVSGPPLDQIGMELVSLGYSKDTHFDEIRSVVDFLKESGVKMWQDEKQTWWASEEDWWSAKAKICAANNITTLIDDKEQYAPYFKGSGCKFHLWELGGKYDMSNLW